MNTIWINPMAFWRDSFALSFWVPWGLLVLAAVIGGGYFGWQWLRTEDGRYGSIDVRIPVAGAVLERVITLGSPTRRVVRGRVRYANGRPLMDHSPRPGRIRIGATADFLRPTV